MSFMFNYCNKDAYCPLKGREDYNARRLEGQTGEINDQQEQQ